MFRDAGFATVGRRLLHGGLSQLLTGDPTAACPPAPSPDESESPGPLAPRRCMSIRWPWPASDGRLFRRRGR